MKRSFVLSSFFLLLTLSVCHCTAYADGEAGNGQMFFDAAAPSVSRDDAVPDLFTGFVHASSL